MGIPFPPSTQTILFLFAHIRLVFTPGSMERGAGCVVASSPAVGALCSHARPRVAAFRPCSVFLKKRSTFSCSSQHDGRLRLPRAVEATTQDAAPAEVSPSGSSVPQSKVGSAYGAPPCSKGPHFTAGGRPVRTARKDWYPVLCTAAACDHGQLHSSRLSFVLLVRCQG